MEKVFLYAGQGSQHVGMGLDFYNQYTAYRKAVEDLGVEEAYIKLMHEGNLEELSKTENTQVCMAVFAVGITTLLKEYKIVPAATCGLSLGEYGALYAAGVFDAQTYCKLLRFRGKAMADAANGLECSMSAVLGMDGEVIREACGSCDCGYVTVANYNCPGQTVICGENTAVEWTEQKLKEKGCKKCIRLNVSGPFHTKFMKAAGDRLKDYFMDIDFSVPTIPVLSNATGNFYNTNEDIKSLLEIQVQNSVHLEDDLRKLLLSGYREYIEIGPGNTMAGFLKRTAKAMDIEISVNSIDSVEDFRKVVEVCTK